MEVGRVYRPWSNDRRDNLVAPQVCRETLGNPGGTGELPEGGQQGECAVLGVGTAAAGRVKVRRARCIGPLTMAVEDQGVGGGQPEPTTDEGYRQQQGHQPVQQAPRHDRVYESLSALSTGGLSYTDRAGFEPAIRF